MEENKTNRIPDPGIPEAIHPEIGNGAAWEDNVHAFLLRIPDPSKQLEKLIVPSQTKTFAPATQESTEAEPIPTETNLVVEPKSKTEILVDLEKPETAQNQIPEISGNQSKNQGPEVAKREKVSSKDKKKNKSGKGDKAPKMDELREQNPAEEEKHPKAGKLVRKAAKSIKRQEEARNEEMKNEVVYPEPVLSPYTQWLKNLAGSQYVHPYEDDFALLQGSGPSKGGISETYADLLAAQGYKEQALAMYLKLMENYPEKSGFFAAKIEALQH